LILRCLILSIPVPLRQISKADVASVILQPVFDVTDIGTRLAAVAAASSDDITLYGAREVSDFVQILRMKGDAPLRRIDKPTALVWSHAPLRTIVTDVLRFTPDSQCPNSKLMRKDSLSPAELEYLGHLDCDLRRWIVARMYSTTISRSLQSMLAATGIDTCTRFTEWLMSAAGMICSEPHNPWRQRLVVKDMPAGAPQLLADFDFEVTESPEGHVAQLRAPLDKALLTSRHIDLRVNANLLLWRASLKPSARVTSYSAVFELKNA
jgi:hypothetical protein